MSPDAQRPSRALLSVSGLPTLLWSMLISVALLFPCSCGTRPRHGITLAGSTSVEPFAERLAELYMHVHPGVMVNVQGGGSSAGIRAVKNGVCEIGMSSRELDADESTLTVIPIAYDAIVIVVHASNPVSNLSLTQARAVFAGRIRNWRELGGPNRPITIVTREEGSGTRSSFEERVMTVSTGTSGQKSPPEPFAADALVQDSNGAVREIVAADPTAVGYISAGLVDHRVRPLSLDGIAPTEENIYRGTYPVVRRFLFLTNGPACVPAQEFIKFALSDSGQQSLSEEGLIRMN